MAICTLKKWLKILWPTDFVEMWGRYLTWLLCPRINRCMTSYRKWCNAILLVSVSASGELDPIWTITCTGLDLTWLLVSGRALGSCLVGISGMLGHGWTKLVNHIRRETLVFLLHQGKHNSYSVALVLFFLLLLWNICAVIYDGRLAWKRSFGNKQKREFSDITVV